MRYQLPLALLLIPAAACMQDNNDDAAQISSALEQENGGFETSDEAPEFAQAELFADEAIEADAAVSDTLATDSEIVAMQAATGADAHRLLVMWGRMPADRAADTRRDWSGELKLSRGALLVRRTIAFEDATDRVLPRASTEKDTVRFASVTRPFVDGLGLIVLDPTPAAAEPITLTYTSADGGTTYSFDLSQLANGPIVVDAGDGNKVVAAGKRGHANNDPCDAGFIRGRWHNITPHVGVFRGVVADADGNPVGHVRGIFGDRRNGEHVMFGKFIDREGGFKGLLKAQLDGNKFAGRWLDRGGDHGVLHGVAFSGAATAHAGNFVGRWSETSCADAPAPTTGP